MDRKFPHLQFKVACFLLILLCDRTLPIDHPTRAARAGTPDSRVSASAAAIASTPELVLSQPLTLRWVYGADKTTNFTPATDGKSVYLPLADGTLVALNAVDGKLLWKSEAGGNFSAAPVADEHTLYVATEYPGAENNAVRGTLRALSKDTGITLWMRTLQAPLRGSLAAGASAVFAGAANGGVYAFDKLTGRTLWTNTYGDEFDAQPMLDGDRLYIGSVGGWLRALNQSTGVVLWHVRTHGAIRGPIALRDGVLFFGSNDGNVYAVRDGRGNILWKRRTGASVQAVAIVEDGVLASSLDNFAYLLSLRHGSVRWRQLLPGRIPARPVTALDGALFTPLSTDSAIVLSLKDGKPVNRLQIGEENSSSAAPVVVQETVFLTTAKGLMAFSPSH
jgi:outer membrane protein assembly factor BamB